MFRQLFIIIEVSQQSTVMNNFRTLIQENHPETRRRSLTTLDSLLRGTTAESFLSFLSDIKNHKKSLKQSEEAISSHFKKINAIISNVDQHFSRRLINHESQIFSLVKAEIDEMRQETKQAVQTLNNLIIKKNNEDEVWNLSNELDYFKSEALKLFNQNKKMRKEISNIKICLKQAHIELENSDKLMQVLKKKFAKQHFIKERLVLLIKERLKTQTIQTITLEDIEQISKIDKANKRLSLKTENLQKSNQKIELESRIQFYLNKDGFDDRIMEGSIKGTQRISRPSSLSQDYSNSEIQSIQLPSNQKSKLKISNLNQVNQILKVQTFTQTEMVSTTLQSVQNKRVNRHFSTTTYIQIPSSSKHLSLDFRKKRLEISTKNIEKLETEKNKGKFSQDKRHMRYMNLVFNKNKMLQMKVNKKGNNETNYL